MSEFDHPEDFSASSLFPWELPDEPVFSEGRDEFAPLEVMPPEDMPPIDPAAISTVCRQEVTEMLTQTLLSAEALQRASLLDAQVMRMPWQAETFAPMVADEVRRAAVAGDGEAVDDNLARLMRITGSDCQALGRGCVAGIAAGSKYADLILRDALGRDRLEDLARLEERGSAAALYFTGSTLDCFIRAAAESGVSPEPWMTDYTVNDGHYWQASFAYLETRAVYAGDDASAQGINMKVAELYQPYVRFPADFVHAMTPAALQKATDPVVRERLVNNFQRLLTVTDLDTGLYTHLTAVATAVARDPLLATPERLASMDRAVTVGGDWLRAQGVTDFEIGRLQLPWKVARWAQSGLEPSLVVATIEEYLLQLQALADDQTEAGGPMDRRVRNGLVNGLRRQLLTAQAQVYAAANDFKAARVLIDGLDTPAARLLATESCLEWATTVRHTAALRPDERSLTADPALADVYTLTEAQLTGDTTALTAQALASAERLVAAPGTVPVPVMPRQDRAVLEKAFRALQALDRGGALGTARQALAALRAGNQPYGLYAYLSDALILAGDPDEPHLAYEHIITSYASVQGELSEDALHARWHLAQTIDAAGA